MKNFTLFKVALCSMIVFVGCTKDDSTTQKEIKQPEEVIDNARLTSISITTNSETNDYSYIYDNDQLKQIVHLGGFNNDTSFFEYNDTIIINTAKNIKGEITNIDTIYISNGKKAKKASGDYSTTFAYDNDGLIKDYRYRDESKSPAFTSKKTYLTTILDSNTLYFTKMGSIISAGSTRYYLHLNENNDIDSMIRHYIVVGTDDIEEQYYYTYTTNQITVEKFTVSGNVSTLKNIDVLTLDNSIDKIIKVERFDANNVKYYEENRTYIVGNSNHELILYTHPMENNVVLLKPYY